jgi:hypothetical protein
MHGLMSIKLVLLYLYVNSRETHVYYMPSEAETPFFGKGLSAPQMEENCVYPRVFQTEFLFHLSHTLVCIFIRFS